MKHHTFDPERIASIKGAVEDIKETPENRAKWYYYVKDRCYSCHTRIKWSIDRYIERGNFCKECNAEAGRTAKFNKIETNWRKSTVYP